MAPEFTDPISILADEEGSRVFLVAPASPPSTFPGPNRIFMALGGFGQDPTFQLFAGPGRDALRLSASEVTPSEAWSAHLSIGSGEGVDGSLSLSKKDGETTILLDARQGDITLSGTDCAEDFDVDETQEVDPGTVMTIGEGGELCQCIEAYDKRVVGVISGAGGLKPGIRLDKQQTQRGRQPLSMVGKVHCKADAQYSPIVVGDLLTTSPTPGHAMKAVDAFKAFGAVLGKALRPLQSGQGTIPIVVALQ